ncbi:MAG: hypothetical protein JWL77_5525 [Chthonomonadaceae bacterium]|nr:hypothetical protein [Chthonomonadaceae bacterium]
MDRNAAAEEFGKMLYAVGIERGQGLFYDMMETPGGQDKQTWEKIKKWYADQPEEAKTLLQFMIKEAMISSVFELAVSFDGASGYHEVGVHRAEFAVSLRIFESDAALENETPDATIEICPTTHGEDVHDIFLNLIDAVAEPLANYTRVRLLTDRYRSQGVRFGTFGYIIEAHNNDAYEVEFSDSTGITYAQIVAHRNEIEISDPSADERVARTD